MSIVSEQSRAAEMWRGQLGLWNWMQARGKRRLPAFQISSAHLLLNKLMKMEDKSLVTMGWIGDWTCHVTPHASTSIINAWPLMLEWWRGGQVGHTLHKWSLEGGAIKADPGGGYILLKHHVLCTSGQRRGVSMASWSLTTIFFLTLISNVVISAWYKKVVTPRLKFH
jgi:hypothetical protein